MNTKSAPTLKKVSDFLNGSAALDGVWFGDMHPEHNGRYWWRSMLNAAIEAQAAPEQAEGEAVIDEAMVKRAIKGMSDYYERDDIFPICPKCNGTFSFGDDYCDCDGGSLDNSSERDAMRSALKAALEKK